MRAIVRLIQQAVRVPRHLLHLVASPATARIILLGVLALLGFVVLAGGIVGQGLAGLTEKVVGTTSFAWAAAITAGMLILGILATLVRSGRGLAVLVVLTGASALLAVLALMLRTLSGLFTAQTQAEVGYWGGALVAEVGFLAILAMVGVSAGGWLLTRLNR